MEFLFYTKEDKILKEVISLSKWRQYLFEIFQDFSPVVFTEKYFEVNKIDFFIAYCN